MLYGRAVRPGEVLEGKFRVERIIGEGAMGLVVEATHLDLDERVALKFLNDEAKLRADLTARFTREARAAATIKNDHVARVYDVGTHDGAPFIVMELLVGTDLDKLLEKSGKLDPTTAAEYVVQACEGVTAAHVRGIVHRDIKPANLFIVEHGGSFDVKVLDFGISKAGLEKGSLESVDHASGDTTQIMGSPNYMSPEQIRSTKNVDARADVWSLGVVLYELLTAHTPFEGDEEVIGIIARVLHEPHISVRVYFADIPVGLEEIIERCLEKDRSKRFQTAAELAQALLPFAPKRSRAVADRASSMIALATGKDALVDSLPPPPMPAPSMARQVATEKKTSPLVFVAIAALLVVLAAGALALFAKREPPALAEPATPSAAPTPSPGAGDRLGSDARRRRIADAERERPTHGEDRHDRDDDRVAATAPASFRIPICIRCRSRPGQRDSTRTMTFSRRLCTLFVFVLALFALSYARPALAYDVADEADLEFQLGAERYETGDYKGALEHFLASNRLVANKNVVFNIARSYEQLKRAPDAYRYYLLALEGETNPQARKRVEEALVRITPLVAILKVNTTPPGATVYLDRKDLGPRGNAPRTLGLPAGKRRVMVEKAGYEPAQSDEVDLAIGQERTITLTLKQILGNARIEGEPGAQVKVDDEASAVACTIPCALNVTPGRHTFFVYKEGFQPGEISAEIPANQNTIVRARLATQTGTVVVSSDVREALVTVDGNAKGFTPTVLTIPVGTHTVTISQQGYRAFAQTVLVARNQESKIDANLVVAEEVVAASRVTESVEDAPASVSIITAQELRAMGYPTIAEAVRGIRGLYISDDRSYVSIGVRGFSRPGDYGNRVLVLLDGQPMNDNYIWSSYVGTDGRVDIDDIDRIEVIRGPGSVLYGSSAFFGVINLITRSRQQPTHVEASLGTFEYGLGKGRVTSVVRFSETSGFWASVSGLQGGGYRDIYFPEFNDTARGNDRQFAGMFTGRFWWKDFTVQWLLNSRKKFLPTAESGTIFNNPTTHFSDTRGMVEAKYEPQVTKDVQSLSRAHFNLYNFDGYTPYVAADGGPSQDTYRGLWGGIEQRFVYNPSSKLRVTAGGEVIQHFLTRQIGVNDAGAYVLDDNGKAGRNDPFTNAAGYITADLGVTQRVKLVAGARFDYYSNLPKFEAWPATNPRLAAIIKPYDAGVIKIIAAKAFRSPSVYELHYTSTTQVAPVKLSPEQIYSGEVEFTHRFTSTWSGTAAAYTNFVENLIVLDDAHTSSGALIPNTVQYQNSPANVVIVGGEVEVRREWRNGWMVGANYSYSHADYVGGGALRDVANSIEHVGSIKGAVPIIGRTIMGMTRLSIEGPRPDRNENPTDPPQLKTDTGVVWDIVLSGEIEKMGIHYNIGIYNALDWKYGIIPSTEFAQRQIIQNGRTFLANVAMSFLRKMTMKRTSLLGLMVILGRIIAAQNDLALRTPAALQSALICRCRWCSG